MGGSPVVIEEMEPLRTVSDDIDGATFEDFNERCDTRVVTNVAPTQCRNARDNELELSIDRLINKAFFLNRFRPELKTYFNQIDHAFNFRKR